MPPKITLLKHAQIGQISVQEDAGGGIKIHVRDQQLYLTPAETNDLTTCLTAMKPNYPAPEPIYDNRAELVYRALGKVKGINSSCEQHRNYPWQLHCETCRRFVAEELVGLGARIETAR